MRTNDYRLSEDFFWAGSREATARNHLLHRENVILGILVECFGLTSNDGANQHLRGCAQRCQMMQMARLEILDASTGERPPIDPYEATRLNLYLNSFYLNLLGALDNLAWTMTHQLALISPVNEEDWQTRRFATLSNPAFVEALARVNTGCEKLVNGLQPWLIDLKRFRDPAAHRKPLSLPRGILNAQEAERYSALTAEAATKIADDDWHEYDRLTAEADAIGRFVPLIDGPRAPNESYFIAPAQMAADRRQFNDFTFDVLTMMFDNLAV